MSRATQAGQCVPLGRLQKVACDASRPVYGPPASLGRCVRSGKANMWPSDVAVGRSVKSDGQFSSSDFTEGLLSEATMTRTGLFPSPESLSEAKRPHAARLPSPKPLTGLPSEAVWPCVAQLPSLRLSSGPLSEVGRPHVARLQSPKPLTGLLSEAKWPYAARRAALSQFATTQQRVRGVRHYGNGRPSRCDPSDRLSLTSSTWRRRACIPWPSHR